MEQIVYIFKDKIKCPYFKQIKNAFGQNLISIDISNDLISKNIKKKLIGLYIIECKESSCIEEIQKLSLKKAPTFIYVLDSHKVNFDSFLEENIEDLIFSNSISTHVIFKIKKKITKSLNSKLLINQLNTELHEKIELTAKESNVLDIFLNSRDKPLDKKEIETMIWNNKIISRKCLEVHVCNLRKKLKQTPLDIMINEAGSFVLSLSEK